MINVGDIVQSFYAPDYYGVVTKVNREVALTTYYSIEWFGFSYLQNPDHQYMEGELVKINE